jgi:hypothetical protein
MAGNFRPEVGSRSAPIGTPSLVRFPAKYQLGMAKSGGVPLRCRFTAETAAIGENLKAQHVDRDVAFAQVRHDALCFGIERGSNNNDLVAGIERFFVERLAEAGSDQGGS